MKTCTGCKLSKPLDSFYRRADRGNRPRARCRACCKATVKTWCAANPEARRLINARASAKFRARAVAQRRALVLALEQAAAAIRAATVAL